MLFVRYDIEGRVNLSIKSVEFALWKQSAQVIKGSALTQSNLKNHARNVGNGAGSKI